MVRLEVFLTCLSHSERTFIYRKSDGTYRKATGTSCLTLIPDASQPTGKGKPHDDKVKRYYDLDADGWRSFNTSNVMWDSNLGYISNNVTEDIIQEIEVEKYKMGL